MRVLKKYSYLPPLLRGSLKDVKKKRKDFLLEHLRCLAAMQQQTETRGQEPEISPRTSLQTRIAAALYKRRALLYTVYTLTRAGIIITFLLLKVAFVITMAYTAISHSPVMVAITLALFFGQALVDVLIESLSRPATALMGKIVTAAPVAARIGTAIGVVRAGICTVFGMIETGTLTVFVITLAAILTVFHMAKAIIWVVFVIVRVTIFTVLAVGRVVFFTAVAIAPAGAATVAGYFSTVVRFLSRLHFHMLYWALVLLLSHFLAVFLLQYISENSILTKSHEEPPW